MNTDYDGSQTIMVIDDDDDIRFALKRIIGSCGCLVEEASSGAEALHKLSQQSIDIVFCDLRFPGDISGEQILALIKDQYPSTQVVLMSCAMDNVLQTRLLNQGASQCLSKPFFKDKCQEVLSTLNGSSALNKAA